MPCTPNGPVIHIPEPDYYGPSQDDVNRLKQQLDVTEAILCGVIKTLVRSGLLPQVKADFPEDEAGVTRAHIDQWMQEHGRKDALRLMAERERLTLQEQAERAQKELEERNAALPAWVFEPYDQAKLDAERVEAILKDDDK